MGRVYLLIIHQTKMHLVVHHQKIYYLFVRSVYPIQLSIFMIVFLSIFLRLFCTFFRVHLLPVLFLCYFSIVLLFCIEMTYIFFYFLVGFHYILITYLCFRCFFIINLVFFVCC